MRTTREREADILRKQEQRRTRAVETPFVPYVRRTYGRWFLVVWDGSVR